MASSQFYVVNQPNPSLVKSNSYECKQGAVRLTCLGMGATGNAVQVWVGPPDSGAWVNLIRYGVPVIMSSNMTQYVEVLAGKYRIDPTGLLSTAVVFVQEDDETDHDDKVLVTYSQQNNNQNGITGESTPSNAVVGNGTNANPLGFNTQYSTDAGNLAHAGADGAVSAILHTANTGNVAFSGLGTVASPLVANSAGGSNLSLVDAANVAATVLAQISGANATITSRTPLNVYTTPNLVVITCQVNFDATATVSIIKPPPTQAASGSIGATQLISCIVGLQITSSGDSVVGNTNPQFDGNVSTVIAPAVPASNYGAFFQLQYALV